MASITHAYLVRIFSISGSNVQDYTIEEQIQIGTDFPDLQAKAPEMKI